MSSCTVGAAAAIVSWRSPDLSADGWGELRDPSADV